jgi:hypothetical protein
LCLVLFQRHTLSLGGFFRWAAAITHRHEAGLGLPCSTSPSAAPAPHETRPCPLEVSACKGGQLVDVLLVLFSRSRTCASVGHFKWRVGRLWWTRGFSEEQGRSNGLVMYMTRRGGGRGRSDA